MNVTSLASNPAISVIITLLAYTPALRVHLRWRWAPPIVIACLPILLWLFCFHEPYSDYNRGASLLTWCLGPATVALAVPMYRNGKALKGSLPRLALIVLIGSLVGMTTAGMTAWLLGAPVPVVMSAVPKSVTTPIAVEVSRQLGGIPQITVALVIVTGVLGASLGVPLLRLAKIRGFRAIGAAIGTSSHGIGTASLLRHSEREASVSSWAMAVAGVFTSFLATILSLFLR